MSASIPTVGLDAYLASLPNRCPHGWHVRTQGCADCGVALKFAGQQLTSAANPDDRARVDAAIRAAAATGRPFSANSIRPQHGVVGPVVGAAFTAARKAGLIEAAGDEISSGKSAHGHRIFQWRGTNAKEQAA